MDRLLPQFSDVRTVLLFSVPFDPLCVTTLYVPPRQLLEYISKADPIPIAMALPDIPFDGFRICSFQRWPTGEIIHTALSLVYGTPTSPI